MSNTYFLRKFLSCPSHRCITDPWPAHWHRASTYLRHPKNGRQYLTELYGLIASGVLQAVVSTEYPLTAEGVAQAQRDQSEGKSIGKILIKVASN